MTTEMGLDREGILQEGRGMGEIGRNAGQKLQTGIDSNLTPPSASSPMGNRIAQGFGVLQGGLRTSPMFVKGGAETRENATQDTIGNVSGKDDENAQEFQSGELGAAEAGNAGSGLKNLAGGENPGELDPKSIDEEAKQKAKDMLGGDQSQKMMTDMASQAGQMFGQVGQQLGQQFQQLTQQFNQAVEQGMKQVTQMASKAAESAASDLSSSLGSDLSGVGAGIGGGVGGGVGGGLEGLGDTVPAGGATPVAPLTAPTALTQTAVPGGVVPPATGAGAMGRGGMVPMMPMHPRNNKDEKESIKRDPLIFPVSPVYEAKGGVEQNFGKDPEILSEEPPFGDYDQAK